tara:strand:+ start:539 stop:2416 length:1878 start_codon:yes stop_codon:yes gene_type:complete
MTDKLKIAILSSGTGSTVKCIYNAVKNSILDLSIQCIVSSNAELDLTKFSVPTKLVDYNDKVLGEKEVLSYLNGFEVDLVVLAGWFYIVSDTFISGFSNVINLHPALPNSFTGMNCVKKAYDAFVKNEIQYTGSMVHEVSSELDRGHVYQSIKVPILENDTVESLEERVKLSEKGILISVLQDFIVKFNQSLVDNAEVSKKVYNGKVRRVEDVGYGCLLMSASDRLSAFDRYICDIPNKGCILNNISAWWFNNTRHIIPNHYLHHRGPHMVVKKTNPIKLEMVVRGYMTGSTSTSIWTKYKQGERHLYGLDFRDGYQKNEKLDEIIVTPTTKGVTDVPITLKEIVDQEYLTQEQLDFVVSKSLELFRYGQEVADKAGLILVDTKYEFGFLNGEIILIDEVHTCDSSRYWLKETYSENFNAGVEPKKLDKDAIRDWIKKHCDPYNEEIPEVPKSVIDSVSSVYNIYNQLITLKSIVPESLDGLKYLQNYFETKHKYMVVVLAGSVKDKHHTDKIQMKLAEKNIYSVCHFKSAHKETLEVMEILNKYNSQFNRNIVYVTVAGRSNALSGVVASNTQFPTIACPPFADKTDFMVNINSTLSCPSKVPVMTILEPENVALCIHKIYSLN